MIGDWLLGGTSTWGELLRTLGFAHAPGLLFVVGIVPFVGWVAKPIIGIWMLAAGVVAVRQALDFSTGKALGTVLLGWLIAGLLGIGGGMLA